MNNHKKEKYYVIKYSKYLPSFAAILFCNPVDGIYFQKNKEREFQKTQLITLPPPRNRLRYCIWHDWKKPERKRKNLIILGIEQGMAYAWSRTRMGGWAVAQSPILGTTLTLSRLKKRGYESMMDYYLKVKV